MLGSLDRGPPPSSGEAPKEIAPPLIFGKTSSMADLDDVRRIASKLPGATEGEGRFGFSVMVKGKPNGFIWSWNERVHPKKPKVPNDGVMAIIVKNLEIKDMLLASGSAAIFTEQHYNGFPAVLVRLADVDIGELEDLIVEAWRCKAPSDLVKRFDEAD